MRALLNVPQPLHSVGQTTSEVVPLFSEEIFLRRLSHLPNRGTCQAYVYDTGAESSILVVLSVFSLLVDVKAAIKTDLVTMSSPCGALLSENMFQRQALRLVNSCFLL